MRITEAVHDPSGGTPCVRRGRRRTDRVAGSRQDASRVDVGTVLAQIYRAQVDQARANAQRARADLLELQAKLHKAEGA
jgi:hypothetical protein